MVLVTTPPQPASNARRMFDSDSVGGADDSRNGFLNRTPVNVVERSTESSFVARGCEADRSPGDRRFDEAERLIGRDENLVRVVEPERRQIDEQMMPVRHRQRDLGRRRRTRPAPLRPSRRACAGPIG